MVQKSHNYGPQAHTYTCENVVHEAITNKRVTSQHIEGANNIADIFTKEDKDVAHFILIRDTLVQDVLPF